jgi:hypothetical protein
MLLSFILCKAMAALPQAQSWSESLVESIGPFANWTLAHDVLSIRGSSGE